MHFVLVKKIEKIKPILDKFTSYVHSQLVRKTAKTLKILRQRNYQQMLKIAGKNYY